MPHIVMEYSNSLEERANVQTLLEALHQAAIDSQLFDIHLIKSRAMRFNHWLVADQADVLDFIHVSVDILEGRSLEQREALSKAMLQALQAQLDFPLSLTVNVREMNRQVFQGVSAFDS